MKFVTYWQYFDFTVAVFLPLVLIAGAALRGRVGKAG
jgi:hypothetical protein